MAASLSQQICKRRRSRGQGRPAACKAGADFAGRRGGQGGGGAVGPDATTSQVLTGTHWEPIGAAGFHPQRTRCNLLKNKDDGG